MERKMNRKSKFLLLLLALLIQPILIPPLIPIISVNASPGVPYQYQSRPTTHATNLTITYVTDAYDGLNGSKASFLRDAPGYFELKSYSETIGYDITRVDLKVRFEAEAGDVTDGDLYRILYVVGPSTAENELVSWTSAGHPLNTYVWSNEVEPNDEVWSWTDITNMMLRIEIDPQGTPDSAFFYVYEVWATVYFTLPYVSVEPTSLLDRTLQPGSSITFNLTVDYVEELWGYQFTLSYNPAVLYGVTVENGPFLSSAGGTVLIAPGPGFDNTNGKMGLFGAALFPKAKFPTGGGVLATVTFQVIAYGMSDIVLGPETGLTHPTGAWIVHGAENPDTLRNSHFDNRQLYVDPSRVRGLLVGESFNVNISVAGVEDLYSWSLNLNWSALLLNATSIVEGDFLKSQDATDFYFEIHREDGYIYANCTFLGAHPGLDGGGTLATVTFEVKGDGNTTLHLYDTSLLNSTGSPLSLPTVDGWFSNEKHTLAIDAQTIESQPLSGIQFTLDGTSYTTPFSDSLIDNEYIVVMSSAAQVGGAMYEFVNWTDGVTEAERTIDLATDVSLTANYKIGALLIHNINTGLNYSSIQAAIDAAETLDGHTITVDAGVFYEYLILDKSLRLIGEDPYTTIIDANEEAVTIEVTADNVVISGFSIRNSTDQGIYLSGSENSTITGNIVTTSSDYGIGIQLQGSPPDEPAGNCTVSNNIVVANWDSGIFIDGSSNNTIRGNSISLSAYGLPISNSGNNTLIDNTVFNNTLGLYLYQSGDNTIYHNSFINSTDAHVYFDTVSLNNIWDDGYPSGGNYWDDYPGVDVNSGPGQDQPGSDGIGDTPNELDADNTDYYPFMHQWRGYVIIDQAVVSDNRVNITSEQTVAFHAKWSLHGTDVTSGTIYVNSTAYSLNTTGWVSFNIAYYTVGKRLWTVTGVLCNYKTTYAYLIEDPYIIWDDFEIIFDGTPYSIPIETNSTISNMLFDPDNKQLSFVVDGPDGTVGYCNISIPKTFMWGEWVITVDDVPVDIIEITEDAEYTYLYFTYSHSAHNVKIVSTYVVPEILTLASILLVLIALAATITMSFYRRAKKHQCAIR